MFPRSATTCERIKVPRSSTLATCSSPCEILTPSTAVSIAGKVQRIFSEGTPTSNGVYRLGSNVSGAAMPPASQSRMIVSAVGSGCLTGSAPRTSRGSPAARAASAAAFMPRRKSRRVQVSSSQGIARLHLASPPHRISWNSGSTNTTQSRSARPSGVGGEPTSSRAAASSSAVGRCPSARR